MTTRNGVFAIVALFLCAGAVAASLMIPGGGGITLSPLRLEPGSSAGLKALPFKGGERACVILVGDHKPVMDLAIYVYDDKGNEVTRDADGLDYCAAIWYPPRDALYTIKLENRGGVYNDCYLSIK